MVDTAFYVPAEKRSRLATVYTTKDGALTKVTDPLAMTSVDAGGVPFGGAGLFSTIDEYARLGQALLNGGQLDGARILGRKTVELMEANELSHLSKVTNQFTTPMASAMAERSVWSSRAAIVSAKRTPPLRSVLDAVLCVARGLIGISRGDR